MLNQATNTDDTGGLSAGWELVVNDATAPKSSRAMIGMICLAACGSSHALSPDASVDAPTDAPAIAVSQQAYVKASNTDQQDTFGSSIAISSDGSTLAVGAIGESSDAIGIDGDQLDNSASDSGAVYIFVRLNDVWSQQAYIKASNTRAMSAFGRSVALSSDGSVLVVGAPEESSGANGVNGNQSDTSAPQAGAAYVFSRNTTTWTQEAYLKASNSRAGARFGIDVSLSGDGSLLAVGSFTESSSATGINGNEADTSAPLAGAVYLFQSTAGSWAQIEYVKASNTDSGDLFGAKVALSRDASVLAVGAPGEASDASGVNGNQSDNSANMAGAVYVFRGSSGVWSQESYVKASDTTAQALFGWSTCVSSDGSLLLVGATGDPSGATGIDGDEHDISQSGAGAAYTFTYAQTGWSEEFYIKASNTRAQYGFGSSVAVTADMTRIAIGSSGESSSAIGIDGNQVDTTATASGAVYLFGRMNNSMYEGAYIKASNTRANAQFGQAATMSADGATLIVGANNESSGATGINGNQQDTSAPFAGAVYVFH